MEGQSGLSELSVISWVSAVQRCTLSGVPLYQAVLKTFVLEHMWASLAHPPTPHTLVWLSYVYPWHHTHNNNIYEALPLLSGESLGTRLRFSWSQLSCGASLQWTFYQALFSQAKAMTVHFINNSCPDRRNGCIVCLCDNTLISDGTYMHQWHYRLWLATTEFTGNETI